MSIVEYLWALPPLIWSQVVSQKVQEPYLDEVFHIPQAQQFCRGDWQTWDPKITTPPGLYIFATAPYLIAGCSTQILRAENAVCLWLLTRTLIAILGQKGSAKKLNPSDKRYGYALHNAINIALLPPLFFFSGLFYTDVASTLVTLVYWRCWLDAETGDQDWIFTNFSLCILGLNSLLFRQTNIFWVVVFPIAYSLIHRLDHGPTVVKQSMLQKSPGFGDTWLNVMKMSFKHGVLYDSPVSASDIDDYIKCVLSVLACSLAILTRPDHLRGILVRSCPGLILLSAFAVFVYWNGSVVLGDKSNHVATLHLPQMLYIWPYFIFFSWPVVLPNMLSWLLGRLQKIQSTFSLKIRVKDIQTLSFIVAALIAAAVTIKFNTIIHPFTLADNRHYTFYVFRLLMRPWWIRYAVIPVYIFSAWACIQTLGAPHHPTSKAGPGQALASQKSQSGATVSFVFIWLAITSLQLITAPLVEPRYLILPWVFWRMHVPTNAEIMPAMKQSSEADTFATSTLRKTLVLLSRYRLWIESTWLILVNVVTGYVFLEWTFKWASEPHNLQRFMW